MNKLLIIGAACLALAGCMTKASNELVPKTSFKVEQSKDGGEITGEFPKDMNIGFAKFSKTSKDGITTSLVLSNVVSATNPDVIKESGSAQAAAIQAMGEIYKENLKLIGQLLQTAKGASGLSAP